MVRLCACFKDVTPLVILYEGTVDRAVYIENVVLDALKYENQVFSNDWVFPHDDAWSHSYHLNTTIVSRQFSIIYRQRSLVSK